MDQQAPPSLPVAPPAPTNTLAIVSLVAGIACWTVLPVIASVVAIVCGHMARREIRESAGRQSGDGLAVAGLVLGYLHVGAIIAGVLVLLLVFGGIAAVIAAAAALGSG